MGVASATASIEHHDLGPSVLSTDLLILTFSSSLFWPGIRTNSCSNMNQFMLNKTRRQIEGNDTVVLDKLVVGDLMETGRGMGRESEQKCT